MAGLAWPQEGVEAVAAAGTGSLQCLERLGPD